MLSEFKTFSTARLQLEDLVALEAFGQGLRDTCARLGIDELPFIDVQLKSLRREIRSRISDKLESRKKDVQRQLDNLKTPAERKKELLTELADLNEATKV